MSYFGWPKQVGDCLVHLLVRCRLLYRDITVCSVGLLLCTLYAMAELGFKSAIFMDSWAKNLKGSRLHLHREGEVESSAAECFCQKLYVFHHQKPSCSYSVRLLFLTYSMYFHINCRTVPIGKPLTLGHSVPYTLSIHPHFIIVTLQYRHITHPGKFSAVWNPIWYH